MTSSTRSTYKLGDKDINGHKNDKDKDVSRLIRGSSINSLVNITRMLSRVVPTTAELIPFKDSVDLEGDLKAIDEEEEEEKGNIRLLQYYLKCYYENFRKN